MFTQSNIYVSFYNTLRRFTYEDYRIRALECYQPVFWRINRYNIVMNIYTAWSIVRVKVMDILLRVGTWRTGAASTNPIQTDVKMYGLFVTYLCTVFKNTSVVFQWKRRVKICIHLKTNCRSYLNTVIQLTRSGLLMKLGLCLSSSDNIGWWRIKEFIGYLRGWNSTEE